MKHYARHPIHAAVCLFALLAERHPEYRTYVRSTKRVPPIGAQRGASVGMR